LITKKKKGEKGVYCGGTGVEKRKFFKREKGEMGKRLPGRGTLYGEKMVTRETKKR